jgi:ribosome-associated translation inhibitor RaiA
MMNVDVRMHQVDLANALRSYLEKRLRLKLGRHADRVRTLKLRLNDEGGATDGTATVCFLAAQLVPSGEVIVMETSPDLYSAVSRAVERLKCPADPGIHSKSNMLTAPGRRPALEVKQRTRTNVSQFSLRDSELKTATREFSMQQKHKSVQVALSRRKACGQVARECQQTKISRTCRTTLGYAAACNVSSAAEYTSTRAFRNPRRPISQASPQNRLSALFELSTGSAYGYE